MLVFWSPMMVGNPVSHSPARGVVLELHTFEDSIHCLSELHAPFYADHVELLLLNDSTALWGTKFTAGRLLKQRVGLCLQCGSQVNSLGVSGPPFSGSLPSHKIIFLKVHTFCSFSLLKSN